MRLIDADKIRYRDMSDGQVNGGVWYTFIEDIQKQPTVDAIPIEWIKKYSAKICADDGGRYSSKASGIDRMIYDWEKENESTRSDI